MSSSISPLLVALSQPLLSVPCGGGAAQQKGGEETDSGLHLPMSLWSHCVRWGGWHHLRRWQLGLAEVVAVSLAEIFCSDHQPG